MALGATLIVFLLLICMAFVKRSNPKAMMVPEIRERLLNLPETNPPIKPLKRLDSSEQGA